MLLSIIILTKNERLNIIPCLYSLREVVDTEVLVLDDLSADETAQLAREAGARVIVHPLRTFADQRNYALAQVTGDWIFFLDADERFSPELFQDIRRHMVEKPGVAGSVVRRNFAFGHPQHFGPLKSDRVIRLFPRNTVRWEGLVHERPVVQAPVAKLKEGHLLHITYRRWDQYLAKQRRYATLWTEEALARGRTSTPLRACGRALGGFLKMFLLNLGILGGPVTWALCWYHGAYTLTKYLRLSEPPESSS